MKVKIRKRGNVWEGTYNLPSGVQVTFQSTNEFSDFCYFLGKMHGMDRRWLRAQGWNIR